MKDTVGIVGAGPFGLALAKVVSDAGRDVLLLTTTASVIEEIRSTRRSERLHNAEFSERVAATTDAKEFASECRFIVLAVHAVDARNRLRILGEHLTGQHILVHAIGAIDDTGSRQISDVIREESPVRRIGALAGPALPGDLAAGRVCSVVCGSRYDEVTSEARRLLGAPPILRLYTSRDLVGIEFAAAMAGAYTIALGLADGLGVGSGTRAVLVTRAVAESVRLGETLGATAKSITGLAGLGNLLVRSTPDSGCSDYRLGREHATTGASEKRSVGYNAALAADAVAQESGQRFPVLNAIAGVLRGELNPQQAGQALADSVAATE